MSDTDLTIKQHKAITALLTGANCPDVARQIGVNERTVQRWQNDPTFKAELDRQRRQLAEQALSALQGLTDRAVARLGRLIDSESESVALRACQFVIEQTREHIELEDLQLRVERLEDMSEDELKDVIRRLEAQ
jgi:phage terminase small subunit